VHDLIDEYGEAAADQTCIIATLSSPGGNGGCCAELLDGQSVLVGSGVGCTLRVDDNAVASHQCLLELSGGSLMVHDWSSGETFVNGQRVSGEQLVQLGDRVEFGQHSVSFQMKQISAAAADSSMETEEVDSGAYGTDAEAEASAGETLGDEFEQQFDETTDQSDPLVDAISALSRVSDSEGDDTIYDDSGESAVQSSASSARPVNESVEDSTIALLHTEIECLQQELEQRDLQLAELRNRHVEKPIDVAAAHASTHRLDDLLLELQSSDERIASLEHELRVLEELQAAESAEHQQIESWVQDIEVRLAKREEENEAEVELLRERLQRESAALLAAEQRADEGVAKGGDEQLQRELRSLRQKYEKLRTSHEDTLEQNRQLDLRCREQQEAADEASLQEKIDQAIRAERLEIAQERAALSRREHEITAKIRELESSIESQPRINEADEKFKVFRERLKELHDQEVAEYQAPTMGQRLVKLWRKLDGPTDRD